MKEYFISLAPFKRAKATILFIVSVGCLLGCAQVPVPAVESYHEVTASEGNITDCRGKSLGPQTKLEVQRGPAELTLDSRELSGMVFDGKVLSVSVEMVKGHTVQLDWTGFHAVDVATGQPLVLPSPELHAMYWTPGFWGKIFPSTRTLVAGDTLQSDALPATNGTTVTYYLNFQFKNDVPDEFSFTFPELTIDGVRYDGVTGTFSHKTGVVVIMGGGC